jgi:hypothetical protein
METTWRDNIDFFIEKFKRVFQTSIGIIFRYY